jgi:hypothetical protein
MGFRTEKFGNKSYSGLRFTAAHHSFEFRFQFSHRVPTRGCADDFLDTMGTILPVMMMKPNNFAE